MAYILPLPTREKNEHYVYFDDAFTPEECAKIVEIADTQGWIDGTTAAGDVTDKRRSKVSWLKWKPEDEWIWQKLVHFTLIANQNFFGFDLSSYSEDLQITKYDSDNKGHYGWHQDVGSGPMSIRKLSFVIQLTDPEAYTGGELELFMVKTDGHAPVPKKQGTMVFFPSFEPHRVVPVKTGVRHSLVGWISGAPLR